MGELSRVEFTGHRCKLWLNIIPMSGSNSVPMIALGPAFERRIRGNKLIPMSVKKNLIAKKT